MSGWLIALLFVAASVAWGVGKAAWNDRQKQRDKFGKHLLKADETLKPMGFTFKEFTMKPGFPFGYGKAVWIDDKGREAHIEEKRL